MSKQDKPRICAVLGVEVGEQFEFTDDNGIKYQNLMVCDDGIIFRIRPDGVRGSRLGGRALCYVINYPECIVRRRRFGPQEVEDAKALKRLVKGAEGVYRNLSGVLCLNTPDCTYAKLLAPDAFPSIAQRQYYTLDEIIEEECCEDS